MSSKVAFVSLIIVLALVNWSVYEKEKHLASGRIVYLDLAPVDPRSLMQGDYMALRFKLADEMLKALPKEKKLKRWQHGVIANDGYVVVTLDEKKVGSFKYFYEGQALSHDEMSLRYRVRGGNVKFATNGFFFQEGHGAYYESARYGQFRVDDEGELLLAGMYDKDLKKLGRDKSR